MQTNFEFLKKDWELLAKIGEMAEYTLYKDPNTSIMKIRQFGEELVKIMFKVERISDSQKNMASDRLLALKKYELIPEDIEKILTTLRKKGNKAVHGIYGDEETAETLLSMAVKVAAWFQEVYGSDLSFTSEEIIYQKPKNIDYQEAYESLVKRSEEMNQQLEEWIPKTPSLRSREERRQLIYQKKRIEFTEAETREIIDHQLKEAGWEVNTHSFNYKSHKTLPQKGKNMAIAEWPCKKEDGKQGYADYALFCGEVLYGILETKRMGTDIAGALQRDSRMYAKGFQKMEGVSLCEGAPFGEYKAPFLFSSNGRAYNKDLPEKSGIWFLDSRREENLPKTLRGFYSPRDLQELFRKEEEKANETLKQESIDYLLSKNGLGLRYYQVEAIQAVEEALISGKEKALLTMATGTGKTMTALGLIYRLLKTKKYKRILFVVDRSALGIQAGETFKNVKIEQQMTLKQIYDIKELSDKHSEDDTKVHVATVQGLIKRILYNTEEEKKPSVGQYDCIIVDEAHRGYILDRDMSEEESYFHDEKDFQSKYRAVLEYFVADKIALTATPAAHTYHIFGEPVYEYSYSQAVLDGYLVDAEPHYKIVTKLSSDGIHYAKGAEIKLFDEETQKVEVEEVLEDELNFDIEQFNTNVITENFNRAVCSTLVEEISPEGPEKTLFYAVTDEHADMLVRILREEYEKQGLYSMNHDMIEKITGSVKDVGKLIKKYKNENYPTIAVTVDLLTTGVDIPKISNLVFLRKVKSRILYHQMLGRATRRCDEIGKECYRVFDAAENYQDLKDFSDMKPVVVNPSLSINDILEQWFEVKEEEVRDWAVQQVIAKLQRKKKRIEDLGEEIFQRNAQNFRGESMNNIESYIQYLKEISQEKQREVFQKEEAFLVYLDTIPAKKKKKVISEHEDEVLEMYQEFGDWKRPEDYLEGFRKYIQENQEKIQALKILKESPKGFRKKDLKELIMILNAEGYKDSSLNSAYRSVKNEDIAADILTYVKNVIKGSPIVDKEGKIEDVMRRIKKLNKWNRVQQGILEKIAQSLRNDNYLTEEDFNSGRLKESYGGYERLNNRLNGLLEEIVEIINEEIILN